MTDIGDIFAAAGPLARALPDYTPRRSQQRMAVRIAEAIESRGALLVEAGTGTGKTFAYLVPALLSGRRVIISTGTRTLQDQLYAKDLPLVAAAIGRPVNVALLKGRANYLCRQRLATATAQRALDGFEGGSLAVIERWAAVTATGDLAEVPELADTGAIRAAVTSTRENCLGQRCPEWSRCHVVAARRAANEADLVIVNHHLLLADLALKEDGFGDLLGAADAVILDEAHQLPDLVTQFFGVEFTSRQIEHLLADARVELAGQGGDASLTAHFEAVAAALAAARDSLPSRSGANGSRLAWGDAPVSLETALDALADALEQLHSALAGAANGPGLAHSAMRAAQLAATLTRVAHAHESEAARSVGRDARGFTLSMLPFDIAPRFRAIVDARPCAWIFTSATLSLGDDFSHFAARLGLGDAATLRIDSPFDFERQGLLYLPPDMPDPASSDYLAAVLGEALPLIEAARGGAFLLFTSHRALGRVADLIRARAEGPLEYPILVQGTAPREQLLREFRALGNAVLLGTASFWEGVDVKGEALRLVVIEKLPFASPEDPLVKARIAHLEATGGNAFRDYQLPEAALALKQGVGRLIRSEEDRGVVAICDPRLVSRGYGRVLRASLPPLTVTREQDESCRFLARHAPAGPAP
ncbi:MAG: putative ATP-dependent helicase DinG [Steroidobacteraceae bacterium]|nr:putative ATP-dependent helicase DinG [Steroidobacteraceae bacterium]